MALRTSAGRPEAPRAQVVLDLGRLLADTYTLYFKTHAYHWNVTGPHFRSLHLMFEEQYRDMWAALDVIAERIRALGALAPQSYRRMSAVASIEEEDQTPEAMDMVRRLIGDHEKLIVTARSVVRGAEAAGDVATADLATQRLEGHEKMLWMLRATVG
ncbi:MAG: DNA starvation/stationary phase protection protein [Chloroflexota bacterium]